MPFRLAFEEAGYSKLIVDIDVLASSRSVIAFDRQEEQQNPMEQISGLRKSQLLAIVSSMPPFWIPKLYHFTFQSCPLMIRMVEEMLQAGLNFVSPGGRGESRQFMDMKGESEGLKWIFFS